MKNSQIKIFRTFYVIAFFAFSQNALADEYCIVDNQGRLTSSCYSFHAACQNALQATQGALGDSCAQKSQSSPSPPRSNVYFDPFGSRARGYQAGVEDGQRLRKARQAAAMQSSYQPAPKTGVGYCRAWVYIEDGRANKIYGTDPSNAVYVMSGARFCLGAVSGYFRALDDFAKRNGQDCFSDKSIDAAIRQVAASYDINGSITQLAAPHWKCEKPN